MRRGFGAGSRSASKSGNRATRWLAGVANERGAWLALAWRTVHLGAVVALGAALLGAPVSGRAAAWVLLFSGAAMLAQDLHARRIVLAEMAGLVVVFKLLAVAYVAWQPAHGLAVFWGLLVLSSLSSHAPKHWRHWRWRPGQRRSSESGPG